MELNVLNPVKIAVEALCRRNVNLLAADAIVIALCKKFSSYSTTLNRKMLQTIHNRISERRNVKLCSLIKYLKDQNLFNSEDNAMFVVASKTVVISYADSLFNRLFGEIPAMTENEIADNRNGNDLPEISFQDLINDEIQGLIKLAE